MSIPPPRPRRACPPGKTRVGNLCVPAKPTVFILPIVVGVRGPFGGTPSGGLAPFSNSAASPQAAPSAAPQPACVTASIFGDCFAGCSGTISGLSPGPVCGWSFDHPFFVGSPGTVSFTPGSMSLNVPAQASGDTSGATKPLPASLASVFGISGQFSFSEFSPAGSIESYLFILTNAPNNESFYLLLDAGTPLITVQVGRTALPFLPFYEGTWTPDGGAHKVDFTVDALGVPTLSIDGAPILLTPGASLAPFADGLPGDRVYISGQSFSDLPKAAVFTQFAVTSGNLPIDTVYCCPA